MERMLQIPAEVCERICESWNRDELSLYGRFDFCLTRKVFLVFWNLMQIRLHPCSKRQSFSGSGKKNVFLNVTNITVFMKVWFNRGKIYSTGSNIHFVGALDDHEDTGTLQYLASTAMEAGYSTRVLDINSMNLQDGLFYDPSGECIQKCFKLYPWEWMIDESPDGCLAQVEWLEPIWKLVMSNKAILSILYELFPDSPYVLPCYLSRPQQGVFCKKPVFSREGHNVSVVDIRQWEEHALLKETEGDYNTGAYVYQEYVKPVAYSGRYPVIGSWIVGGEPAGIGIRENRTEITDNLSEFVPHIISCL